jgi:hypothetical protein
VVVVQRFDKCKQRLISFGNVLGRCFFLVSPKNEWWWQRQLHNDVVLYSHFIVRVRNPGTTKLVPRSNTNAGDPMLVVQDCVDADGDVGVSGDTSSHTVRSSNTRPPPLLHCPDTPFYDCNKVSRWMVSVFSRANCFPSSSRTRGETSPSVSWIQSPNTDTVGNCSRRITICRSTVSVSSASVNPEWMPVNTIHSQRTHPPARGACGARDCIRMHFDASDAPSQRKRERERERTILILRGQHLLKHTNRIT